MALDKLEAMRAFCRIVETGNFTTAADTLGVPATTLSGQIRALETQLGIQLLHRTTRKVAPTSDGLGYYRRIASLLQEMDEIHSDTRQQSLNGWLKVEMSSPLADYLIVPNLPRFSAVYPDLQVEIGSSERVVDLVKEGVDCALRGGVLTDDRLVSKLVGQMPFCLCASPNYLRQHPAIKHIDDLPKHRHLAFRFATSGKFSQVRLADSHEVLLHPHEHPPAMIYNNAHTYHLALLAGLGIGFIPRVTAEPHLQNGSLTLLLPEVALAAMPISFAYPYSRYTPKRVKCFGEWVQSLIAEQPLWQV